MPLFCPTSGAIMGDVHDRRGYNWRWNRVTDFAASKFDIEPADKFDCGNFGKVHTVDSGGWGGAVLLMIRANTPFIAVMN